MRAIESMERGDSENWLPSRIEPFTHDSANQFIDDYFPAIRRIVGAAIKKNNMVSGTGLVDDAFGDALERISKDLHRFDPGKNMKISSYLFVLATWGIQEGLRESDAVSKRTRQTLKNNMTPSGEYDGPFSNATFHATHPPLSLDELPENISVHKAMSAKEIEEECDDDLKWKAIQGFLISDENPLREKEMLWLRLNRVTVKEIGKRVGGVSESRASQILQRIAGKLKILMEEKR